MSRFFDLEPMLARAASELPPADGRWAFEVKWDGFRALAHFDGKHVRLRSRKGNDLTPLFPELQSLAPLQRLTRDHRLEGVVAKRIDSRYEPGRRSGAWRKIKNWQQIELVIGGWIPAEDGGPQSLLLGEPTAEGLHYVALAELGLFGGIRRALAQTLPTLTTSENRFVCRHPRAILVEPRIRVRCQFLERTASGRLRHVLLLGLVLPGSASAA